MVLSPLLRLVSLFKAWNSNGKQELSEKTKQEYTPFLTNIGTSMRAIVYSHEDYYLSEKHMPEKYKIGKELVSGRKVHISDLEKTEDLIKRFVIINVPENYLQ